MSQTALDTVTVDKESCPVDRQEISGYLYPKIMISAKLKVESRGEREIRKQDESIFWLNDIFTYSHNIQS